MRAMRSLLIFLSALFLCLGGSAALAAQAEQNKQDKPTFQAEESAKAKETDKGKTQQDDRQPQPANVPPIKKDEGC